jgi:membrane associated rhomboid family serine protease
MIPLKDENPTRTFPFITIVLIFTNIAIFIYQLSLGRGMQTFVYQFGATPYEVMHNVDLPPLVSIPPILTLFTSMFLHSGLLHLIGNMLYLWIFGNNIEDYLGHFRFIIFYVICGLIASLSQVFANIDAKIPLIGASGAIAGILGAYLILYPRARILTFVFLFVYIRLIKLPALYFLGFWFLFQLLAVSVGSKSGVAWLAHIGGFVAGVILIFILRRKRRIYIEDM